MIARPAEHHPCSARSTQHSEDRSDYAAFRQHVQAIGAPDPGEEQFEEFGTDFEESGQMGEAGSQANS